jgi:hypothetical protein
VAITTVHFFCYNLFFEGCLTLFRYAAPLEQAEVDTASGLRSTTDVVRKELDSLLGMGRGACVSLQIAEASHLSATGLSKKLQLVPGLVADWKQSAARGGARTALMLAKAHYPELSLDLVTLGLPEIDDDGMLANNAAIRQSVLGYDQLCALGTQLDVYYEAYALPGSPSHVSVSIFGAADAADSGDGATFAAAKP